MTDAGATIVTSDDKVYQNASADELFHRLTGIRFPVQLMQDWIKGQPTQADSYTLNETYTLNTLNKIIDRKLWRLSYASYQDKGNTPLPYQMYLHQEKDLIQIKINQWTIQP
jgi:outer membrane lipoprotein LolB